MTTHPAGSARPGGALLRRNAPLQKNPFLNVFPF